MTTFKDGDHVRIVRRVDFEEGWHNTWVPDMDSAIGEEGTVKGTPDCAGVFVWRKGRVDRRFPPSALELVTDEPKKVVQEPPHFDSAILSVLLELQRAIEKFPDWPVDPLHAVGIIGEEFGELTQAVLQTTYEPGKSSRDDVRAEAIQTAAMALRFIMGLSVEETAEIVRQKIARHLASTHP